MGLFYNFAHTLDLSEVSSHSPLTKVLENNELLGRKELNWGRSGLGPPAGCRAGVGSWKVQGRCGPPAGCRAGVGSLKGAGQVWAPCRVQGRCGSPTRCRAPVGVLPARHSFSSLAVSLCSLLWNSVAGCPSGIFDGVQYILSWQCGN